MVFPSPNTMPPAVDLLHPCLGYPSLVLPRLNPNGRRRLSSSPLWKPLTLPDSILTPASLPSSKSERRLRSLRSIKCGARYAILGAGFAGLSVAWHLLKHGAEETHICVDIYDEVGIGAGASGASGGLLHPYSPKAKLLWRGAECWKECSKLIKIAEGVMEARGSNSIAQESACSFDEPIVLRRGILRPATEKNLEILKENTLDCLESCTLELLDRDAAQGLVPGLHVPFNSAVYMPLAMNIHPKRYLQALLLACQNLVDEAPASYHTEREIHLYKKSISSLNALEGKYDAVIICLGAKVDQLPELSGKLPLRTCRGVVAELQLQTSVGGEYSEQSPSILSDAWLAFQGPRSVFMGSTWDWNSKNYSSSVSLEEASQAVEQLLPKASAVYPAIRNWAFSGARAGLRAMPPLTSLGSLPLVGCVNDAVRESDSCMYWLFGGLGSRGLLYHGLLGKLIAEAVISSDENVLPPELTSWKRMKSWKGALQRNP